jgi:hypothetical protein
MKLRVSKDFTARLAPEGNRKQADIGSLFLAQVRQKGEQIAILQGQNARRSLPLRTSPICHLSEKITGQGSGCAECNKSNPAHWSGACSRSQNGNTVDISRASIVIPRAAEGARALPSLSAQNGQPDPKDLR